MEKATPMDAAALLEATPWWVWCLIGLAVVTPYCVALRQKAVREYYMRRIQWIGQGPWALPATISTICGFILAILTYGNPEWVEANISPRMNAVIVGIIPLFAGLSVFIVRWVASPYFVHKADRALIAQQVASQPRFGCNLSEAVLTHRNIQDPNGEMKAWLAIKLRFVNKGEGTAKNLKVAVYSYWLLYPDNIDKWADELYGTWGPGDSFEYEFKNRKTAFAHGVSPGVSKVFGFSLQDTLVACAEIEFETDTVPGSVITNEPLWFWWNGDKPDQIEPTNSTVVASGKLKIEEFKGLGPNHRYKSIAK